MKHDKAYEEHIDKLRKMEREISPMAALVVAEVGLYLEGNSDRDTLKGLLTAAFWRYEQIIVEKLKREDAGMETKLH